MKIATTYGMPVPVLRELALKLMANLTDTDRSGPDGPADQRAVAGDTGGMNGHHEREGAPGVPRM